jgi:predicted glutamine amidotransferase
MCRLLGVVSARRTSLARTLGRELDRFVKLACDHPDGWGVAYASAIDELVVAKEPGRPDGSELFSLLTSCQATDAAIMHLRMASPGSAIALGNTHPFSDGRTAFAHNGAFAPTTAIDSVLEPAILATMEGATDSERFYQLVRGLLAAGAEPAEALISAAATIRASAKSFESLNSMLLTTDSLYTFADHNPESEVLGRRGPDFFDLRYRVDQHRVLIGSTGWPRAARRWRRLEPRQVLRIDRRDLRVTVHDG